MKAAVLYDYNQPLVVEEVELDPPKAGEVLIKVGAAGICRSDLHFMKGEARAPLPMVLGHEASGTVEEVGSGITSVKPGDRVVLSFVSACGRCYACVTGHPSICDTRAKYSMSMYDGTSRLHKGEQRLGQFAQMASFAQYSVVPEAACIPAPGDFPLEQAALIGCSTSTGVGAVTVSAQVEPGSTVAVVGCGGVGLNVVMGAGLVNAKQIIAVDVNEGKLEFAMKFGATHSVNPTHQDPVARVKEITGGRGVDYAFEVFGSGETVEMAYNMIRRGGTAVVVGIAPLGDKAPIDAVSLVRDEKTLKGTYYGSIRMSADLPKMMDLYLSGRLNLDDLITRRYSLDQINQAFEDLDRGDVGRGVITSF
ncbi:MAG: Zn-dependent alcohol dehydrogenase [Dehalococcoidia bacterium]